MKYRQDAQALTNKDESMYTIIILYNLYIYIKYINIHKIYNYTDAYAYTFKA